MYTYTWKKYLPVLRLLLKKSASGDQTVTLNRTDFEKTTKLRKPACMFSVLLSKGKLPSGESSVPAKDLLAILLEDENSRNLLLVNQYELTLSSDFSLLIRNVSPKETELTEGN